MTNNISPDNTNSCQCHYVTYTYLKHNFAHHSRACNEYIFLQFVQYFLAPTRKWSVYCLSLEYFIIIIHSARRFLPRLPSHPEILYAMKYGSSRYSTFWFFSFLLNLKRYVILSKIIFRLTHRYASESLVLKYEYCYGMWNIICLFT